MDRSSTSNRFTVEKALTIRMSDVVIVRDVATTATLVNKSCHRRRLRGGTGQLGALKVAGLPRLTEKRVRRLATGSSSRRPLTN